MLRGLPNCSRQACCLQMPCTTHMLQCIHHICRLTEAPGNVFSCICCVVIYLAVDAQRRYLEHVWCKRHAASKSPDQREVSDRNHQSMPLDDSSAARLMAEKEGPAVRPGRRPPLRTVARSAALGKHPLGVVESNNRKRELNQTAHPISLIIFCSSWMDTPC